MGGRAGSHPPAARRGRRPGAEYGALYCDLVTYVLYADVEPEMKRLIASGEDPTARLAFFPRFARELQDYLWASGPRSAPDPALALALFFSAGLCKLHHAAYDQILDIRPDLIVEIRLDILRETDGPMLQHGLQSFEGRTIQTA